MSKRLTDAGAQGAESTPVAQTAPKAPENQSGFYVYLGPYIQGVLNHGAVIEGSKDEVLAKLSDALKTHPLVRTMLVPGDLLPQAHAELKDPSSALYRNYRRVLKK